MRRFTSSHQVRQALEDGEVKVGTRLYCTDGIYEVTDVSIYRSDVAVNVAEVMDDDDGKEYLQACRGYMTQIDLIGYEF